MGTRVRASIQAQFIGMRERERPWPPLLQYSRVEPKGLEDNPQTYYKRTHKHPLALSVVGRRGAGYCRILRLSLALACSLYPHPLVRSLSIYIYTRRLLVLSASLSRICTRASFAAGKRWRIIESAHAREMESSREIPGRKRKRNGAAEGKNFSYIHAPPDCFIFSRSFFHFGLVECVCLHGEVYSPICPHRITGASGGYLSLSLSLDFNLSRIIFVICSYGYISVIYACIINA